MILNVAEGTTAGGKNKPRWRTFENGRAHVVAAVHYKVGRTETRGITAVLMVLPSCHYATGNR